MGLPQLDHLKMVSLVPITWSSGSILGHESVSHVHNLLHFVHVYVCMYMPSLQFLLSVYLCLSMC